MAKRIWDEFDEAAEREGVAYKKQITTQIIKGGGREGKAIRKQRSNIKNALNDCEMRILRKHLV